MPRPMLLAASLLLANPFSAQSQSAYSRRFLPVRWEQVGSPLTDDSGDLLWNPLTLTTTVGGNAVVIDWGDRRLKAITPAGHLLWAYGKRGAGPGELGAPAMATRGADGHIWLADRGNARAYAFDSVGTLQRAVQLQMIPERVFARSDGLLFVQPNPGGTPLLTDPSGRVKSRFALPAEALAADPPMRIDVYAIPLSRSRVALSYSHASLLVLYDSLGHSQTAWGPDAVGFPQTKRVTVGPGIRRLDPDTDKPEPSRSLATDEWRLFVLAGVVPKEPDDDRSDLIDVFAADSLGYLGSWRLPRRVFAIAWVGQELIALYRSPTPGLIRWRPH